MVPSTVFRTNVSAALARSTWPSAFLLALFWGSSPSLVFFLTIVAVQICMPGASSRA